MEEISQELARELADAARAVVANWNKFTGLNRECTKLKAIVAMLPEPVDPDLVEARRMAADLNQGSIRSEWLAGKWDAGPAVEWHLAGIRRGRELAKARAGEGSGE